METEKGICFPIHFVVSVSLKLSSCMQMDSKSNLAKFLKNVCSSVYSIPEESSFCWVWYTFFGWAFLTRSLHVVKRRSNLNILLKKVSKSGRQKIIENCFSVVHVQYVVVLSQQSHRIFVLLHTSSSKFSDNVPIQKIFILQQNDES